MTAGTRSLFLLLTIASIAACSGSGGDDDDDAGTSPTPVPTDSATKTFTLNGSGFQVSHIGEIALVRVFVTSSASSVVFCGESAPITNSGVFSVASPAAVLTTNASYTVELFANVTGGSPIFNSNTAANPDHIYVITSDELDPVGDDVVIDFAHGPQSSPSEFKWTPGTGCPGLP